MVRGGDLGWEVGERWGSGLRSGGEVGIWNVGVKGGLGGGEVGIWDIRGRAEKGPVVGGWDLESRGCEGEVEDLWWGWGSGLWGETGI